MNRKRTPVSSRKGIKFTPEIRSLYEKRNRRLDKDPDSKPLAPDRWATAFRRAEFFRRVNKLTNVRNCANE
jgi:hypothetical protein